MIFEYKKCQHRCENSHINYVLSEEIFIIYVGGDNDKRGVDKIQRTANSSTVRQPLANVSYTVELISCWKSK